VSGRRLGVREEAGERWSRDGNRGEEEEGGLGLQGGQTACWSRGGQVKPPGPGGEITARRLCRSPVPSQWALQVVHEDQGPTAQSCEQRTAHSRSCAGGGEYLQW